MSDTPSSPVEGLTQIEAFKRIFGPEAWKASRERAAIELIDSTRGGSQWRSLEVRGAAGNVDFTATAELSRARWELEIDARATALLVEQFTAMLVAGKRATSGRIGDPFAPRIQLEPSQWRYLDLNSRSGEAIAVGPDGLLVYDVKVHEHPWTSVAAEQRPAPAAADVQVAPVAPIRRNPKMDDIERVLRGKGLYDDEGTFSSYAALAKAIYPLLKEKHQSEGAVAANLSRHYKRMREIKSPSRAVAKAR
jgi:hypothetical protein